MPLSLRGVLPWPCPFPGFFLALPHPDPPHTLFVRLLWAVQWPRQWPLCHGHSRGHTRTRPGRRRRSARRPNCRAARGFAPTAAVPVHSAAAAASRGGPSLRGVSGGPRAIAGSRSTASSLSSVFCFVSAAAPCAHVHPPWLFLFDTLSRWWWWRRRRRRRKCGRAAGALMTRLLMR